MIQIAADKKMHFLASYGLVLTFAFLLPLAYACLAALAVGIIKELIDYLKGGRFCLEDIGFNVVGVFFAIVYLMGGVPIMQSIIGRIVGA